MYNNSCNDCQLKLDDKGKQIPGLEWMHCECKLRGGKKARQSINLRTYSNSIPSSTLLLFYRLHYSHVPSPPFIYDLKTNAMKCLC